MPKAKYDSIYRDLKEKIETESYSYQDLLPSEHTLIQEYGCSRNTVRRALAELASDGYVQPMQGKGVRNIFQPVAQTSFTVGGIESFLESALRNHQKPRTKVLQFAELETGEKISRRTGFPVGTQLYYLQRLRYLDDVPLILDHNYFLKELMPGLTPEIAEHSIYEYLEQTLGFTISTSKRTMTVERVTQVDETYLDMNDYNCMAVISSQTFNADGIQLNTPSPATARIIFSFRTWQSGKRTAEHFYGCRAGTGLHFHAQILKPRYRAKSPRSEVRTAGFFLIKTYSGI